ncbi:hypothetical protein Tco_0966215 [Tanacetum coccineum]
MDAGISLVPPHAVNEGRNDDTQIYDLPVEQLGVFSAAIALADVAKKRISTADVSTASDLGSTAGVKAKDKGKAIMQEFEPPKKVKKRVQVQMSMDEELAKKLDEREEVAVEPTQAQQIAWSDPVVLRYHAQLNRPYSVAEVRKNMVMYLKIQGRYKMNFFKGMKYEDIRPIFEKVWDQIQSFAPMDSEKEKDSEMKGSRKKSLARKRAGEKQCKESTKRQKIEDDAEKEELKALGNVDAKDMYVYKLTRADGSSSYHRGMQAFLRRLDRQDLNDLYSCGVHTMFMDGTPMEINMLVEKKYPLIKELLEKMMNLQLEAEEESTIAFELIKFIKSMLKE